MKVLSELSDAVSALYEERLVLTEWPPDNFLRVKDELLNLEKQTTLILHHYTEDDGTNLREKQALYNNPTAGRTFSANQGLKTAIELVYHITAFTNQESLLEDVHTRGVSAYMYRLLQAQREKMDLYGRLIELQYCP